MQRWLWSSRCSFQSPFLSNEHLSKSFKSSPESQKVSSLRQKVVFRSNLQKFHVFVMIYCFSASTIFCCKMCLILQTKHCRTVTEKDLIFNALLFKFSSMCLPTFDIAVTAGHLILYLSNVFKEIRRKNPELTADDVISYFNGRGGHRMLAQVLRKCLENQPDNWRLLVKDAHAICSVVGDFCCSHFARCKRAWEESGSESGGWEERSGAVRRASRGKCLVSGTCCARWFRPGFIGSGNDWEMKPCRYNDKWLRSASISAASLPRYVKICEWHTSCIFFHV